MTRSDAPHAAWPVLPAADAWRESYDTLHMWLQVVGKIRLSLAPWVNHSWGSTLYVTPRGFTTSPIPHGNETFEITFDFIDHRLQVATSRGELREFGLRQMPVAAFYRQLLDHLHALGIEVRILARPVEVQEAIPFADDNRHAAYDADVAGRIHAAFVQADRVFKRFRARFIGKASPVHVFWGAFDLAATRFSGRAAPLHPGGAPNVADWVMQEAYSHELASAGFWPGAGFGEPAFYAYAYPEPPGYRDGAIEPEAAFYSDTLGEFILPYEAVRTASDPDALLLEFLQSTYERAANCGEWDRAALERATRTR